MKYFRRELKVCEGCGGLWVRTGPEAGVYCRHCAAVVADLPGRRRRSPGRPRSVHGRRDAAAPESVQLRVVQAAAEPVSRRQRCSRGAAVLAGPDLELAERLAEERRTAFVAYPGGRNLPQQPCKRAAAAVSLPYTVPEAVAAVGGVR